MDHRQALRSLEPSARRRLLTRSDRRGLVQLAGHLGLLALTGALVALAWPSPLPLVPALLLHGVVLVFLFAPLHETIHNTAFATRRLNTAVAHVCGFLLLLPPRYFEAFHVAHHRHTQDPARDPELMTPKPTGWRAYFWHLTGLPYWVAQVKALIHAALNREPYPFITRSTWPGVVREARLYLLGYAAVTGVILSGASNAPLAFWVLPALLSQPFLRAYLLAEHTACPLVADMLANSRTTLTSRLVRHLAWNMSYHAEHHAMPGVPFHRLPALHATLRPHLKKRANGYVEAHKAIIRDQVLRGT